MREVRLAIERTELVLANIQNQACPNSKLDEPLEEVSGVIGDDTIEFFHCNLNGFATNAARVVAAIRLRATVPHVVFLNETKTDQGDKLFELEGFVKVYRGDRCKGGGGIADSQELT